MISVSIIVPIYNVEPFLEKCIRSLEDQDLPKNEYEIICVNDGSPDNSQLIVEQLQKEFPNIILVNQKNAGVSVARNKGIELAQGEYLLFIDPDDFVNPGILKKLYERANEDDLDILLSGRSVVYPNGTIFHMLGYESFVDEIYDGVTAYYKKDIPFPVWDSSIGRLYRKDLIDYYDIDYPTNVIHLQDGIFVRKTFAMAKKVGFDNSDFYQVFERAGSTSRSGIIFSKKAAEGDLNSVKNLRDFKNRNNLNSEQAGLINNSIIKYALLPLMRAINNKNIKAFSSYNKTLVNEGFGKFELEHIKSGNYLKYGKAYNKSAWYFALKYFFEISKKSLLTKFNLISIFIQHARSS